MTTDEIVAKLKQNERLLMDVGLLGLSRDAIDRLLVLEAEKVMLEAEVKRLKQQEPK